MSHVRCMRYCTLYKGTACLIHGLHNGGVCNSVDHHSWFLQISCPFLQVACDASREQWSWHSVEQILHRYPCRQSQKSYGQASQKAVTVHCSFFHKVLALIRHSVLSWCLCLCIFHGVWYMLLLFVVLVVWRLWVTRYTVQTCTCKPANTTFWQWWGSPGRSWWGIAFSHLLRLSTL